MNTDWPVTFIKWRRTASTPSRHWAALSAALRDVGYAGAVVIESFTPENEAIATAAAVWPPPAASQDAIAADGLRPLLTKGSS